MISQEIAADERIETGTPVVFSSPSINKKRKIGGFIKRMDSETVTLSYENPLCSSTALYWTRDKGHPGNRRYCLSWFGKKERMIFPEIRKEDKSEKDFQETIRDPEKIKDLVSRLTAGIGDFIVLGKDKEIQICGFVEEVDQKYVVLRHENPLNSEKPHIAHIVSDEENYRLDITSGKRKYNLINFNFFDVLKNQEEL